MFGDGLVTVSGDGSTDQSTDGNDSMWGGAGYDEIWGQGGNDYMVGNSEDDTLVGGSGIDSMWGSAGSDHIYGYDHQDGDYMDGDDGPQTYPGTDVAESYDAGDIRFNFEIASTNAQPAVSKPTSATYVANFSTTVVPRPAAQPASTLVAGKIRAGSAANASGVQMVGFTHTDEITDSSAPATAAIDGAAVRSKPISAASFALPLLVATQTRDATRGSLRPESDGRPPSDPSPRGADAAAAPWSLLMNGDMAGGTLRDGTVADSLLQGKSRPAASRLMLLNAKAHPWVFSELRIRSA
jgi:hypothetical protein